MISPHQSRSPRRIRLVNIRLSPHAGVDPAVWEDAWALFVAPDMGDYSRPFSLVSMTLLMTVEFPFGDRRPGPGRANADGRRSGRVRLHGIVSTIGTVLDLSVSGMRVRCAARVPAIGAAVTTMISTPDGPLEVVGTVVWTRKCGWITHEAGIRFGQTSPPVREALTRLARMAGKEADWH